MTRFQNFARSGTLLLMCGVLCGCNHQGSDATKDAPAPPPHAVSSSSWHVTNLVVYSDGSSIAGHFQRISYCSNLFVIVGYASTIVTSNNGKSWTVRNIEIAKGRSDSMLRDCAYGNGIFVAVGHGKGGRSAVFTSVNGEQWSPVTLPEDNQAGTLARVVFAQDQFVTVSGKGQSLFSSDGHTWRTGNLSAELPLLSLAYGGGQYVCGGIIGYIATSTSGRDWIPGRSLQAGIKDIVYGHDGFVAAFQGGVVGPGAMIWSKDAATWESIAGSPSVEALIFIGKRFVGVDAYGGVHYSDDGKVWKRENVPKISRFSSLASSGSLLVAVGDTTVATLEE